MEPIEAIEIAGRFLAQEEQILEEELLDEVEREEIEEFLRHQVTRWQSDMSDANEIIESACGNITYATPKEVQCLLSLLVMITSQNDWDEERALVCSFHFILNGKETDREYLVSGDLIEHHYSN